MGLSESDPLSQLSLPPGFRFYPTDEELLVQYLCRKVAGHHFSLEIIGAIDLYKFDPWVLPSKAIFGEKEWYFFSPRDRKYPNGSRPNRVAGSGYWKATGTDKVVTTGGRRVGIKKALVFYVGKAPNGSKTNWIMHEYRLSEPTRKKGSSKLDDWVLCRIYKKNSSGQKPVPGYPTREHSHGSSSPSSSKFDDMLESFPAATDGFFTPPRMNALKPAQQHDGKLSLLQNLISSNFDWASLAGATSSPEFDSGIQVQNQTQGHVDYNACNYIYVPAVPPICLPDALGSSVGEEVQSGARTQRVENSGFYQQIPSGFTHGLANAVDPFGIGYPTQTGRFVFKR